MSAESVYRALLEGGDDVGLATVYRVLTQFEAAGLVVRHNFDGGHAVFELETPEHHDHMVDIENKANMAQRVRLPPFLDEKRAIADRLSAGMNCSRRVAIWHLESISSQWRPLPRPRRIRAANMRDRFRANTIPSHNAPFA